MTGLSLPTVRSIIKDIYEVMEADLRIEDIQVGGVGSDGQPIVVETDESKFGKRKYNKGKRVDGVWVVGGVERTPERKVFLLTVSNRNQNTLKLIIDTFVKDGSHVMVDCWKGYKGIDSVPSRNLIVRTVNHSKTFRDPKTGACINTIEGTWNGTKRGVTSRHRTASMMPWKLVEFIWRRKHAGNHWKAMLACFSQVTFTRAGIADQGPLVSLLTTVFEDATGDQGNEEPFIFISDENSNSESDGNDTSVTSTPVKKLRTA
ncbi:hypothetical protein G6F46_012975 [Rhizopus delemar]|uniref:ISXO2-like transposase domain-containing protein n=3 Tax=Rhizopus TaxID=4842 RepID=I1BRP8_RHIO9|nr:hypothetical protein RO3G_03583 [Rhizopus delemar RA 99-880]KAG1488554.1 hypothetical protein G6F54_012015 [Rhizopus delemar]KAG1532383.1 hypothetical protein G6F51_013132 [Rhizopus arrhizus]KAG1497812.1 hypothetical protein G6F53_011885 [Rhizopus delemar]KAG1521278.1 hypothetical protein G6F52_006889 [Rhizopus delemar]|eukprot:EIE78878.1 hypothetical protein RO3G_03583 [Rhizopus delemar RA 99-880]